MCQDVTERHEAERALRRSEASLRALFDGSLDGIVILDDEGRVVDMNPAACDLFGRRRESIVGTSADNLYPAQECRGRPGPSTNHDGEGRGPRRRVIGRSDGTRRQVDFLARSNYVRGCHLALIRDVTSRKNLEEQLAQSQKMEAVGRLAGGVAHDFNNVLTAINGYAELMLDELRPGDPLENKIQEILKAGKRAAALTYQLLAFSRKQVLQPRVLNANCGRRQHGSHAPQLIGEDIELTTRLARDLGNVKADANQLEQVLMNLVVNARDALPRAADR